MQPRLRSGRLNVWIDGRGGTEPAEARQAIEAVQLFIERYGEAWRRGSGPTLEWVIPPGVWRTEVCSKLDPQLVAKTLNDRNMLPRSKRSFQVVRKVHGGDRRVYVVTAKIFDEEDRR
jgi:putative DNA primase/helicase